MTLSLLDAEPLRQRLVRRDQGVVGVHDALGLAGGAGGEHQQGDLVRVRPQRGQLGRVAALLPRGGHERLPGRVRLAGLAVDDEHVLQGRPVRPEPVHHRRVVEAAELPRHDDDLGFGEPDHEADLAVPVDRDQRVADRADPGGREVQRPGTRSSSAAGRTRRRRAGRRARADPGRTGRPRACSSRVGDLPAGVDRRGLVRGAGGRLVEEVGDGPVRPVARLRCTRRWSLSVRIVSKRHRSGPVSSS